MMYEFIYYKKIKPMKRFLQMAVLALLMVPASVCLNAVSAQYDNNNYDNNYGENRDVTYQDFYDELSPYGRWIENGQHGYVWVPDAGPDFQPYSTNGHWVWTENYEWMWVSDYDWGWAPFHYGRWEQDSYNGWYWVPGYEWSPAWVAWRNGGDYYGWAPLRPGINININFNLGGYNPPNNFWCFVPRRHISSPRIYDYYMPRHQNISIINYTTIINYNYGGNYGFRSGPSRYEAERYCGRINPVRLRQSYSPGRTFYRNNEVSMYRPNVRRDDNRQFSPRQFERNDRSNGNLRNGRSDNGISRMDNNRRDVANNNGRPAQRERVNNDQPFRRNENNVRLPQNNNNTPPVRQRVEQPNNDNRSNGQPDSRRINRPVERTERTPQPVDNNRRIERRSNENSNGNQPVRQPTVRNNGNDRQQRQPATQVEPRRQENTRQFDRNENRSQQQNNGNRGNSGNSGTRRRN